MCLKYTRQRKFSRAYGTRAILLPCNPPVNWRATIGGPSGTASGNITRPFLASRCSQRTGWVI